MIFHHGTWYCVQCGKSYETYQNECHLCSNDKFQDEPIVQPSDNDQLTEDELILINFNVGNF